MNSGDQNSDRKIKQMSLPVIGIDNIHQRELDKMEPKLKAKITSKLKVFQNPFCQMVVGCKLILT